MKHFLCLALILLACQSLWAQKSSQDRLKDIRTQYAQAKKGLDDNYFGDDDQAPRLLDNMLTLDARRVLPMVGPTRRTLTCYSYQYPSPYSPSDMDVSFPLVFATISQAENIPETVVGPTSIEMLFDQQTGNLAFYFQQSVVADPEYPARVEELRYYFNPDGSLCKATLAYKEDGKRVGDEQTLDHSVQPYRVAYQVKRLFDQLMNPELTYRPEDYEVQSCDLNFFEAKGQVKSIRLDDYEFLEFSEDGELLRVDGYDAFRVMGPTRVCADADCTTFTDVQAFTRDANGRISRQAMLEYIAEYTTDAGGRILRATNYGEGGQGLLIYHYDDKGLLTRQEEYAVDEEGHRYDPTIYTYTYLSFDSHGNWTSRRNSEGLVTNRTIVYY